VGVLPSPLGDPTNQQLYSVNTSTGALTIIGSLNLLTISSFYYGIGDGINGLAYDQQENILYGISFNGNLYRINVNDASTTLIGPTQSDCRGLAYDASAQKLWAIDANATLYEIDKNTGSVLTTVPCQEEFDFITSLAYAPSANEIQEITCSDTLHIVFAPNNFLDLGNDTLLCNTTEYALSQPGFSQYLWQDGSESNSFEVTESGQYVLQATSNAGCVDTDTVQIQLVSPTLSATASPSTLVLGDTAQLTAVSDATSYVWTPSDGLSCSNCPNPLATPVETTEYIVFATDSFGCRVADTVTITVDIRCNEVFIPSIFSPNGKGPQANETFCVYSDCVEQFKLVIHNRWGQRIFESENINTCWDGTFNGQAAQSGVYAFNLYLRQLDGTVVNKTGTITLVK
jgi:gliding motility-associated-like protein